MSDNEVSFTAKASYAIGWNLSEKCPPYFDPQVFDSKKYFWYELKSLIEDRKSRYDYKTRAGLTNNVSLLGRYADVETQIKEEEQHLVGNT